MKKRKAALSLLLSISLFLTNLFVTPVFAVSYSDVKTNDWFYTDVTAASDAKIINGYPDGTFRPKGLITRAEFIKMFTAAMQYDPMGGFYFSDTLLDAQNNLYWFHEPVSTALHENILYRDEYNSLFHPNTAITRKEAAVLSVRALDISLSALRSPYLDADDAYINALFNEGIMQGSADDKGNRYFYPEGTLTRAEASTIITRILNYRKDKAALKVAVFRQNQTQALPVSAAPYTKEAFFYSMFSALQSGNASLQYVYDGVPYSSNRMTEIQENIFTAFRDLSSARPELTSLLGLSFVKSGNSSKTTVSITFETAPDSKLSVNQILANSAAAKKKAAQVLPAMIEGLTNDSDKAAAIHDYLVLNTSYANTPTDTDFTAYGALVEGKAVCQGYTAAFNLLCSLAGVKSQCVQNNDHAWNAVAISGTTLFYDATWDDPVPDVKGRILYDYCGIGESDLISTHVWDKSTFFAKYFD